MAYKKEKTYGPRDKRETVKHSGCEWHAESKNAAGVCMTGWQYNKQLGMRSFIAVPAKKFKTKNENYHKWVVKVSQVGVRPYLVTGFLQLDTRKIIIKDLQYIMNPHAPNGGYVGSFVK